MSSTKKQNKQGDSPLMLNQTSIKKQLPNEIFALFSELKLFHHLRISGATKKKGFFVKWCCFDQITL